jgi:hypothetical protein
MSILSFNGKTYNSLEEMPADQRAAYEQVMAFMKDENNNGIPDMFEGDTIQKMIKMSANTRVMVNGQEVLGLDALQPEVREKFDRAMQTLERLGILPTGMPGKMGAPLQSPSQPTPQIAPIEPSFTQSPSVIQSPPSVISEDTGSGTRTLLIVVLGVLLLCALAAVAILLFLSH